MLHFCFIHLIGESGGLFEETARLFGFKLLLRKHCEKECSTAYGIGHGGSEVVILLGINYPVLAQIGVQIGTEAATSSLLETAKMITFSNAGIAMFERVSAMMLQSGLSMIMNVDYLIGRYRVVLGRESRPKTVFDHTELGDGVTGLYKNLRGYLMCCQDIIYHRSDIGGFGGQDVRIILYEIKIDGWQMFTVVLTCKVCIRL